MLDALIPFLRAAWQQDGFTNLHLHVSHQPLFPPIDRLWHRLLEQQRRLAWAQVQFPRFQGVCEHTKDLLSCLWHNRTAIIKYILRH